jgi:hypothetical protein
LLTQLGPSLIRRSSSAIIDFKTRIPTNLENLARLPFSHPPTTTSKLDIGTKNRKSHHHFDSFRSARHCYAFSHPSCSPGLSALFPAGLPPPRCGPSSFRPLGKSPLLSLPSRNNGASTTRRSSIVRRNPSVLYFILHPADLLFAPRLLSSPQCWHIRQDGQVRWRRTGRRAGCTWLFCPSKANIGS